MNGSDLFPGGGHLIGEVLKSHASAAYMSSKKFLPANGGALSIADYPVLAAGRGLQGLGGSWVNSPAATLGGGSNNTSPTVNFDGDDVISVILRGAYYAAFFRVSTASLICTMTGLGSSSSNGLSFIKPFADRAWIGMGTGVVNERTFAAPGTSIPWNAGNPIGGSVHCIEIIDGYVYVAHTSGIHRCPLGADKTLAASWASVATGSFGSAPSGVRTAASIFKDPATGNLIFSTDSTSNILVSSNGGASFTLVGVGGTTGEVFPWQGALWKFPSTNPTYANASALLAETNEVYLIRKSVDGGLTWALSPMRLVSRAMDMRPFAVGDYLLYQGQTLATSPQQVLRALKEERAGAVDDSIPATADICVNLGASGQFSSYPPFRKGNSMIGVNASWNATTNPLYRNFVMTFDIATQFALPLEATSPPSYVKVI